MPPSFPTIFCADDADHGRMRPTSSAANSKYLTTSLLSLRSSFYSVQRPLADNQLLINQRESLLLQLSHPHHCIGVDLYSGKEVFIGPMVRRTARFVSPAPSTWR